MKKLLLLGIMLLGMGGVIFAQVPTELKSPILLTGASTGVTVEPYGESTMEELYAATFTPTGDLQNVFQHLNMEIPSTGYEGIKYQKIVVKFKDPIPGGWNIHAYGGQQNYSSLEGKTQYEIPLNGTIDDFTIFNWFGCRSSITVTEAYFYYNANAIPAPTRTATDAKTDCFQNVVTISDEATYDTETKTFTGTCGFKWTDGIDLSQYQYLVITAGHSRNLAGAGYVYIEDINGMKIGGEDYGESYFNMWLSTWNHHNCCLIDLEKLRSEKGFDIYNITELGIDGSDEEGDFFVLGNVYASNTKPITQPFYNSSNDGSFKLTGLTANKFGTICLPYQAAVACAKIYEIDGASSSSISLKEIEGLMEAGKPYFYYTTQNANPENTENNVFFYQATAATVATPVENNGLIGTFEAITAPQGDNFYVLSNNKLYYTTDATVNVAANKAYVDMNKIVNKSSEAKGRVTINFDGVEATGIESVDNAVNALNSGDIYDLSGRKVTAPTSGIYIMNGKKIVIK